MPRESKKTISISNKQFFIQKDLSSEFGKIKNMPSPSGNGSRCIRPFVLAWISVASSNSYDSPFIFIFRCVIGGVIVHEVVAAHKISNRINRLAI